LIVDRATPRLIGRGDLLAALDPAAAKKVTILSALVEDDQPAMRARLARIRGNQFAAAPPFHLSTKRQHVTYR
jgi:hypothetical protein